MTPNNNLSVLPFYDSINKQNHRKDYAFGEIFPLTVPDRRVLPFQIIRPTSPESIIGVKLVNLSTGDRVGILEALGSALTINRFETEGYDIIQCNNILPMNINTPEGQYYLELDDGVQYFYSEVFCIVRNTDNYLTLEYGDEEDLIFEGGRVCYADGFRFRVYLPTQLGRPDYEFSEQVDDRDGYKFIEKQISEKTYKFNFTAPEYLCDAMRLVRMSDYVTVTNKGDSYNVDSFLMTPTWLEGGYLAKVECEFQCDTVIKKLGRASGSEIPNFNNDFNNDFNKN